MLDFFKNAGREREVNRDHTETSIKSTVQAQQYDTTVPGIRGLQQTSESSLLAVRHRFWA